jgi:hypothetical protein
LALSDPSMTLLWSSVREVARLAASATYRVGLLTAPGRLVRAEPSLAHVSIRVSPPLPVAPEYDADTKQWVEQVLAGSFRSPFIARDPEAMHDTLRLRGVLPALAAMCLRGDSTGIVARVAELLRHTAALADRYPIVGWDTSTAALRLVSILDAVESLERLDIPLLKQQPWITEFVAAHRRALRAGTLCEPAGNHSFLNAAGWAAWRLLLGGRKPLTGAEVDGVVTPLRRQFLPDGGHVEMTPHYHVQVLALAQRLLAADLARTGCLCTTLKAETENARKALSGLLAPDGSVTRFGDASRSFTGRTIKADVNFVLGASSGHDNRRLNRLANFGMTRWRWGSPPRDFCLFLDAGALGMPGNAGHGHADMLSFSLYIGRIEVIADPGTYLYAETDEARWFKRQEAHNTVCWPDRPVADLARFFRWRSASEVPAARLVTPAPRGPTASESAALFYPDGRRHRRSWTFLHDGLRIVDEVRQCDEAPVHAKGTLTLHPDCTVASLDTRTAVVRSPAGKFAIELSGTAGHFRLGEGWYAPTYGLRRATPVLTWPVPTVSGAATVHTYIRLLN